MTCLGFIEKKAVRNALAELYKRELGLSLKDSNIQIIQEEITNKI